MLEFKKKILKSVSFDLTLFEKELRKAIEWLLPEELVQLKRWCYQNFKGKYIPIVEKCFTGAGL